MSFCACTSDEASEDKASNVTEMNQNLEEEVLDEKEMDEVLIGEEEPIQEEAKPEFYKILSLGDSYTIGTSVCKTCRFPEQLKAKILTQVDSVDLRIIATNGWTTSSLLNGIKSTTITNDYDFVTLLIGVNNQFQGRPFELYEKEFPELLNKAIRFAKGNKKNVVVLSIPDYAFTPFGRSNEIISKEIDAYNLFAENTSNAQGVRFLNITDITRKGLEQAELVARDALHPSEVAYEKFVERLYPLFLESVAKN